MAAVQNVFTKDKVHFSYHNYSKGIFFDEKKKRFVDFGDMDFVSYRNYNSPFNFYRPDFFRSRSIFNDRETFTLANMFLEHMYRMRAQEIARMQILFRRNSYFYMQPLWDYHIKMGQLDKNNLHKYLKWDDATLSISYLDYVIQRIKKYGLNFGPLEQRKFPNYKEILKAEEDKLTEYFLYEMRKEPLPEKNIAEMPLN